MPPHHPLQPTTSEVSLAIDIAVSKSDAHHSNRAPCSTHSMPARNLLLQAPAYLFFAILAYVAINMLAAFALNLEVCCETDTHPVSW